MRSPEHDRISLRTHFQDHIPQHVGDCQNQITSALFDARVLPDDLFLTSRLSAALSPEDTAAIRTDFLSRIRAHLRLQEEQEDFVPSFIDHGERMTFPEEDRVWLETWRTYLEHMPRGSRAEDLFINQEQVSFRRLFPHQRKIGLESWSMFQSLRRHVATGERMIFTADAPRDSGVRMLAVTNVSTQKEAAALYRFLVREVPRQRGLTSRPLQEDDPADWRMTWDEQTQTLRFGLVCRDQTMRVQLGDWGIAWEERRASEDELDRLDRSFNQIMGLKVAADTLQEESVLWLQNLDPRGKDRLWWTGTISGALLSGGFAATGMLWLRVPLLFGVSFIGYEAVRRGKAPKKLRQILSGLAAGGVIGGLAVGTGSLVMDRVVAVDVSAPQPPEPEPAPLQQPEPQAPTSQPMPLPEPPATIEKDMVPPPIQAESVASIPSIETPAALRAAVNATSVDIPPGSTVGHLLVDQGYSLTWEPADMRILGAHLAVNLDNPALIVARVSGLPLPTDIGEIQTLMSAAEAGDLSARARLLEFLHWILAGGKFFTLPPGEIERVLSLSSQG